VSYNRTPGNLEAPPCLNDGPPLNQPEATIAQIKQQLDQLFEEQRAAFDAAVYLGMTPEQVKIVEARRQKISALVEQLARPKMPT